MKKFIKNYWKNLSKIIEKIIEKNTENSSKKPFRAGKKIIFSNRTKNKYKLIFNQNKKKNLFFLGLKMGTSKISRLESLVGVSNRPKFLGGPRLDLTLLWHFRLDATGPTHRVTPRVRVRGWAKISIIIYAKKKNKNKN